eukprot:1155359-Pelagomonas_calceolata.AAC.8
MTRSKDAHCVIFRCVNKQDQSQKWWLQFNWNTAADKRAARRIHNRHAEHQNNSAMPTIDLRLFRKQKSMNALKHWKSFPRTHFEHLQLLRQATQRTATSYADNIPSSRVHQLHA